MNKRSSSESESSLVDYFTTSKKRKILDDSDGNVKEDVQSGDIKEVKIDLNDEATDDLNDEATVDLNDEATVDLNKEANGQANEHAATITPEKQVIQESISDLELTAIKECIEECRNAAIKFWPITPVQIIRGSLSIIIKNNELFSSTEMAARETVSSNFDFIIKSVIDEFVKFFSREELATIISYLCFEKPVKSLFLLILLRKSRWFQVASIKLPNNKERVSDDVKKLKSSNLLIDSSNVEELEMALKLCGRKDVEKLASKSKIQFDDSEDKSKVVNLILQFASKSEETKKNKLNEVRKMLNDKYYKLNHQVTKVFWKVILLFFQPQSFDKDIFQHYFKLIQKMNASAFKSKFINCKIQSTIDIYSGSEDLNRFVDACFIELSLNEGSTSNASKCLNHLLNLFDQYLDLNYEKDLYLSENLSYLRKLTTGDKLISCMSLAIDRLMSKKQYELAIVYLQFLVKQQTYCANEIGKWYFKYIEILDINMEKPNEAIALCKKLLTLNVKRNWKYRVQIKQREIESKVAGVSWEKSNRKMIVNINLTDAFRAMKRKLQNKSDFEILLTIALNHYKDSDTICEKSLKSQERFFNSIFLCLWYDQIFALDVPHVFRYHFQKLPLDYGSDNFMKNRLVKIKSRHEQLKKKSMKDILKIIRKQRERHTICDSLPSNELIKEILDKLDTDELLEIFRFIINNHSSVRDQCPNLIMWNSEEIKFVHVKFENEFLSAATVSWIKEFEDLEIKAEVLNVTIDQKLM